MAQAATEAGVLEQVDVRLGLGLEHVGRTISIKPYPAHYLTPPQTIHPSVPTPASPHPRHPPHNPSHQVEEERMALECRFEVRSGYAIYVYLWLYG